MTKLIQPNEAQLRRLKAWRTSTFWVMLLGYVGYYLIRKNLSAAFPLLEDAFQYTNEDLGLIASMSTVAYAVGKFINGPLADKFGGRRFFLLGMLGGILFNLIFATMSSLTAFVIVWCGCRFFLSAGWGGIVKTIGSWYEQKRHGTVMGLISVNFQFGGVAATLFSGLLVAYGLTWVSQLYELGFLTEGMAQWLSAGGPETAGKIMTSVEDTGAGWRLLFICPALVVTVVFLWSFFASKDHPHKVIEFIDFPPQEESKDEKKEQGEDEAPLGLWESMVDMFKSPLFLSLLLFSMLTTVLRSIFMFWIPKFLTDIGLETSNAIIKSALFPFLGALGTIILGWYTDRYSKNGDRAKVMWMMLVVLTACLFGIGVLAKSGLENEYLIVSLIGLCGFFLLGPYSMTSGCLTLDIVGHRRAGACSGLLDGGGYICAALATYLVGRFADDLGWATVFSLTAVVALVSAGSAFVMSLMFQRKAQRELKGKA